MLSLLDVQRAVYRSLVARDDAAAVQCIAPDGLAPEARLSIYRNTFIGSLTTALRLSYPAIHRLVGEEFFGSTASMFIQCHPPEYAYLDLYGAKLPQFLMELDSVRSLPYLPEVAQLELAVAHALHAPDMKPLDMVHLAKISISDRGAICFVPHPSISLLNAAHPVDAIWRAVLAEDDSALARIDLNAGAVWLLIERLDSGVNVTRLDEPAWRLLSALCASRPLEDAIKVTGPTDVSAALAEHLAAGRFVSFTVNGRAGAVSSSEVTA